MVSEVYYRVSKSHVLSPRPSTVLKIYFNIIIPITSRNIMNYATETMWQKAILTSFTLLSRNLPVRTEENDQMTAAG
jgi:hypothetical protein